MSVVIGNEALASDYETLATAIEGWFSDGCSTCSFGDADQRKGWGGSVIPVVTTGDGLDASHMNALVDRCNIGIDITDSTSSSLAQIVAANNVLATNYNNIEAASNNILNYKNDIDLSETSIAAGTTDARTSVWATTIDDTARYTFTDFDEARYFFNSGGAIVISLVLSGGTTGNAVNWATLFSTMGTITVNDIDTTQSGSGGSVSSIGYYDATTNWQTIITQSGTGSYATNNLEIQMRRSVSGDYVEFQILLDDAHTGSVDGTTTATFQYRKLDNQSSGGATLTITAPVASIQDTFE